MIGKIKPSEYQLIPLLKLLNNNLNSILIADGVGVGKTISAGYIVLYSYFIHKKPVIIFCPAHLTKKWKQELRTKFHIKSVTVNTSEMLQFSIKKIYNHKYNSKNPNPSVIIISHAFLHKPLPKLDLSCIIFDEIHNFRNPNSKSYKMAHKIAQGANYRVGLSATPVNNSNEDFSTELSILLPIYDWGSINNVIQFEWAKNLDKISFPITTSFRKDKLNIHFTKRNIHTITINYDSKYITNVRKLVTKHKPKTKNLKFFDLVQYYRMAASNKVTFFNSINQPIPKNIKDEKITKLNSLLSKKRINKAIIFCSFKGTVRNLSENIIFPNIYTITGDTPDDDRETAIENFENSKRGILLMTEIGAEGLDLQFCSNLINYDLHWNPMRLEQRIGRIDRIGQIKNNIHIYNFHVNGSIDERILHSIIRKLNLIDNSAFQTDQIINIPNKINSDLLLYDKISFKKYDESEKFLESIKLTENLISKDYEIIKNIKKSFCILNNFHDFISENNPSLIWKNSKIGETWIDSISNNSEHMIKDIEYYE